MQEKMGRGHRDPVLESPPKREILRAREERDPNMGTGLALGTDKNREKEMKRQKQLEYKQQLDQITAQKGSDNRHGGNETSPRRSRLPQEEPHGRFDQQQPYSGRSDPYSYDDRHGPNRREAPPPRPQENLRQPDYASNGRHKEPESSYTDKYQFQIGQSAANTKATITSLSDQEKDVRRLRQEEYRRQLDAQKGDKQKRLDEEKAAAEKLERIFETDKSASSPPQKSAPIVDVPPKSQRGYPEDDRDRRGKEPYQDEGDSYGRRDDYGAPHRPQYPPSKAVSFDEGYSTSNDKRIPDDILYDERFQALLKERLMQDQEKQIRDQLRKESYQPEPRKDARDDYRSSEYYRREETDYVRPRDSHNYDNRDSAPPGGYEGRLQLDERSYAGGNHHAPSASYQDSNAVSPGKSPKPARNQLVQDIYGKNSLTEHNDSAGKDSWKPSGKNYTEKQKASINEQKAALDLQIEADKARKKAEKEAEKALELKLEQKLQATMNAEKEHARIEKEKKSKLLEQSQKELADMQEKKTKEALARKNLLSKRDNEATPNGKNVPPGSEMRANNRSYEERTYSDPPRDHRHEDTRGSYEHIRSPLKDLLDSNPSQRDSYNPPANYHNSPPRGGNRPPPNVSSPNRNYLQEPLTADSVDRFMNNYQNKVRDSPTRHAAPPPQVHSNYNHPARDSYDRDYDNRRDYADPYYPPPRREPPPQYYEQQRAPYVDRSYDRQSENDGDFSFVSESRFVPANPWRASDIISAMIPLQSVPEYGKQMNAAQYPAVDASYDRGPPPASKKPKNDLEQSLASDSLLMYLGRRTPMTEPKVANDDSMRSTAANTMANASSASIVTNARGKTAERLDPASMPVAGRPTSKHAEALGNHESPRPNSGIEVRRVIQQPIVPTAEDVPNNRVFVNKGKQFTLAICR